MQTLEALIADGKKVYSLFCAVCHQTDGGGINGGPPSHRYAINAAGAVHKVQILCPRHVVGPKGQVLTFNVSGQAEHLRGTPKGSVSKTHITFVRSPNADSNKY